MVSRNDGLGGTIREFLNAEDETLLGTKVNGLCDWDNGDRDDWAGCGTHTAQLEPILDQHEPCESDFKASLDKLLERVEA